VLTGAPAGHSAPNLVIYCGSIHEWIELTNTSGQLVDLGGWMLDDEPEGLAASVEGSTPYAIPARTMIEPGGFRVFYRRETGVVRLMSTFGRAWDSSGRGLSRGRCGRWWGS
jgi:hypothetical protein